MNNTLIIIMIATGISFILTMLALLDSIRKDFGSPKTKTIWHIIAMIPFIGWILYFLIGAKKGVKMH